MSPLSRRCLLAGLLASFTVAACGRADTGHAGSGGDLSRVILRVGDQKAGSQALLSAAGELDDVPYRIEWSPFQFGPPLLEAVNAQAVDIGGVGNTPPIFAAAAGAKIKVVAAHRQDMSGAAILVPAGSPIRRVADLKGKRVAVAKGSSANYHLLAVLRKNGLAFSEIQVSYLAPPDALAAFTAGRVDAWTIWDPYTAQAQAAYGARVLVDGNGYSNGLAFQVAGERALADPGKAAAIRDYLTRLARARVWANQHPEQWAKVWAQQTGLPYEAVLTAARRSTTVPIPIDDAVVASEQEIADAFADARLVPRRIRFADFVDRRFNDVLPTPAAT
ncbi:ABC transporter substrate-binding protein [Carbonactinospora thermoautotrophica]|uniref:Putative aliphatic sulfonates-binding protein n=1 Tax=Carbonactinospora thermoautotrophica TaxID=1469144 RepID=A0A132N299_9ACTN|nr:ABC transporter substrate-binding protein [Carbonactinospora thermoautotrophica]KWW99556.1 Aliphatic sulfonates family ABC transporter [Carbonactinospora thermoautotrophica]KWX04050.1 ABC transporter substrate-binding protein [Carbonactinospora thermoautotrophica]KWX09827.1 ABC transporter substrate-binding protein [Carbonactinospora thermoautotrophica]